MAAEGNHLRYGMPLARDILNRLRSGRGPTGRDLADAMGIEEWQLVPGGDTAPYLLEGKVAGRLTSEVVIALDPVVGWARTFDRWFVLGEADPNSKPLVTPDGVMQATAVWIDRHLDDGSVTSC
jgi:hypothetical protein